QGKTEWRITAGLQDEFVEPRPREGDAMFCSMRDLGDCVIRLHYVVLANLTQANRPDSRQVNGCHECTQGLIRTDVGSRFLATDVLLTRGQCQDVRPSTQIIFALTNQTTRHLPNVSLSGCEKPNVWTSKARRNT